MALLLRIASRAASEIERAEKWWVENRPSAPLAVREDFKAAFALLLQQPGVGVKVGNTRLSGVRRLHLGRIRYFDKTPPHAVAFLWGVYIVTY